LILISGNSNQKRHRIGGGRRGITRQDEEDKKQLREKRIVEKEKKKWNAQESSMNRKNKMTIKRTSILVVMIGICQKLNSRIKYTVSITIRSQ
jgi:hypothetical protein